MARADESFYNRTQEELLALGLGPADIARQIGCSACMASNWMNGESLPGTVYMGALHNLGVDVLYILTGKRIWDQVDYWMDTALKDIPTICSTCAYFHDCELDECDMNCSGCEKAIVCRTCQHQSNWLWRGFAPGGANVRSDTD